MKIVGFNFTKISAEKLNSSLEGLQLDTNIDIPDVKEVKTSVFKSKEELVSFEFKFNLNYKPDIAKIEFKGVLILSLEPKQAKNVLNKWKDGKIDPEFRIKILNIILRHCNLKAINLEEELNLPLHFRMPSLKLPEQENSSQDSGKFQEPSE